MSNLDWLSQVHLAGDQDGEEEQEVSGGDPVELEQGVVNDDAVVIVQESLKMTQRLEKHGQNKWEVYLQIKVDKIYLWLVWLKNW